MKDQIKKLSLDEGHTVSRLPEFTEDEKIMINGTLDFYSLQMYSSRIVTSSDPLKRKLLHLIGVSNAALRSTGGNVIINIKMAKNLKILSNSWQDLMQHNHLKIFQNLCIGSVPVGTVIFKFGLGLILNGEKQR